MRRALSALGLLVCAACPAAHAAIPPQPGKGAVLAVADSVKVTAACLPVAATDTLYTVRCHNQAVENGTVVADWFTPMNGTSSFTYAHASLTGTPGIVVSVNVTLRQTGVNRSNQESNPVSQLLSTQVTVADGAPSAPKAVGGTIKYCPAGTSCP